jgi:hypothetical protein
LVILQAIYGAPHRRSKLASEVARRLREVLARLLGDLGLFLGFFGRLTRRFLSEHRLLGDSRSGRPLVDVDRRRDRYLGCGFVGTLAILATQHQQHGGTRDKNRVRHSTSPFPQVE